MEVEYPVPQQPPEPRPVYAPLNNEFLERGREGKNEWWRYMLGVVISFGGYFLFSIPAIFVITNMALKQGIVDQAELQKVVTNPSALGINPNLLLCLLLLCFAGALIGLWFAVKFIHGKRFISIITASSSFRWKRLGFAALMWIVFYVVWMGIAYLKDPGNLRFTFQPGPFLGSLIIALILLPAQTWWEEFMMRGYLLQAIGQRTRTAWLPVIITSVVFGLLHSWNPEVAAGGFWQTIPLYIMPGLLFGLIAALDGGLEIPMGFHLANNLFGTVVITNDISAIQAHTIWRQNTPDPQLDLLSLLLYPLMFVLFWVIYKWDVKKLYT
jgi:uncharacterized protein